MASLPASLGFIRPIPLHKDGRPPQVTSGFGGDRGDHTHAGIDIFYRGKPGESFWFGFPWRTKSDPGKSFWFNPPGTPVLAAGPGKVVYAKVTSKGHSVRIDHGYGYDTYYTHMTDFAVAKGQLVKAGQIIGHVGDDPSNGGMGAVTDKGDAAHLHFGIYHTGTGDAIDPEPFWNSWGSSRWPSLLSGAMGFLVLGGGAILGYRYWKNGRLF